MWRVGVTGWILHGIINDRYYRVVTQIKFRKWQCLFTESGMIGKNKTWISRWVGLLGAIPYPWVELGPQPLDGNSRDIFYSVISGNLELGLQPKTWHWHCKSMPKNKILPMKSSICTALPKITSRIWPTKNSESGMLRGRENMISRTGRDRFCCYT